MPRQIVRILINGIAYKNNDIRLLRIKVPHQFLYTFPINQRANMHIRHHGNRQALSSGKFLGNGHLIGLNHRMSGLIPAIRENSQRQQGCSESQPSPPGTL